MLSLELLLIQIINGLFIGFVFTLVALGLSIVMGLLGVVNFAHGALYMLGAYVGYTLICLLSQNYVLGFISVVFACAGAGLIIFLAIVKPLKSKGRPPLDFLIALIGVNMIMEESIKSIWGAEPKYLPIPQIFSGQIAFGSLLLPKYQLCIIAISSVVLLLIYYFFYKTDVGIRSLASVEDPETASLQGVNLTRLGLLIFVIGAAVAGAGGILIGPIFSVTPTMGIEVLGLIFVIVIFGGLGSLEGTFLASILICEIRSLGSIFLPETLAEMLVYCLLLLILITRPRGIKGYAGILE